MLTLYGLKTCDTCRKARRAAENAGIKLTFVDVRDTPLAPEKRAEFYKTFGEKLINRASTTWRNLGEAERQGDPLKLLADHPTLMKRPVIEGKTLTLGWNAEIAQEQLG